MITCTCAGTHATKFTCAIYRMREIIVFSLFVSLLLYLFPQGEIFHEGFFAEHYMQEN